MSLSSTRTFTALLLLALALLVAGAGTAAAGTLSSSGGKIFYVADAGETDELEIEESVTSVTFDANVTLDAQFGSGCAVNANDSTKASCFFKPSEIHLNLKDGNDEVTMLVSPTQGDIPLYVTAGSGHDTVVGGRSRDEIYGNDGNDTLTGGASGDRIEGDRGNDTLDGQSGGDFLEGDEGIVAGDDDLTGGPGLDIFQGGAGDDVLHAIDGAANETVSCGSGSDDTAEIDRFFDSLGQLIAKDNASGCESLP